MSQGEEGKAQIPTLLPTTHTPCFLRDMNNCITTTPIEFKNKKTRISKNGQERKVFTTWIMFTRDVGRMDVKWKMKPITLWKLQMPRQLLRDKSITIQTCTELKFSLNRRFGMNLINGDDQQKSVQPNSQYQHLGDHERVPYHYFFKKW